MNQAIARARFELPRGIYLTPHVLGPLPVTARPAVRSFLDEWSQSGASTQSWWGILDDFRQALARLLGGNSRDYCPVPNVSAALVRFLGALRPPGGARQVLITDLEFPTIGIVAEHALNAPCRIVRTHQGRIDLEEWASHLDERVCAAVISHATSTGGSRMPVLEMVELARSRGVPIVVDVAQSAGVLPIDVQAWGANAVVGSCVKWLCGGSGAGFLWVRPETLQELRPRQSGWLSAVDPFDVSLENFRPAVDARRFLGGTPPLFSLVMATQGLQTIEHIGVEAIHHANQQLIRRLVLGLGTMGFALRSPEVTERRSGTLAVLVTNAAQLVGRLEREEIYVDARGETLRISPHLYNSEEEIDRTLDVLVGCTHSLRAHELRLTS